MTYSLSSSCDSTSKDSLPHTCFSPTAKTSVHYSKITKALWLSLATGYLNDTEPSTNSRLSLASYSNSTHSSM